MSKWKYWKLNEFNEHLSENNRCFVTSKKKVQMNPPTGSFLPQKLPRTKKRQWERGHQKGLWFCDRWGGFIWLQRLPESFRLSFGSLLTLSVVQAKRVICLGPNLKPTPADANKRSEQYYFLSVCPYVSMAISPLFLNISCVVLFLSGTRFY